MVLPTRRAGFLGEGTFCLELINWMLRRDVDAASVATLVETLHVAVQWDDEYELSFAERLRRLNTKCAFMSENGVLKGRFVEVFTASRSPLFRGGTPPE